MTRRFGSPRLGETQDMRFSGTEKKCYALIPQIATIRDAVMMVKGSIVPLDYEKKSTDWKLIGHAYVPGLMKGE
jgi:hypothetical protein